MLHHEYKFYKVDISQTKKKINLDLPVTWFKEKVLIMWPTCQ